MKEVMEQREDEGGCGRMWEDAGGYGSVGWWQGLARVSAEGSSRLSPCAAYLARLGWATLAGSLLSVCCGLSHPSRAVLLYSPLQPSKSPLQPPTHQRT